MLKSKIITLAIVTSAALVVSLSYNQNEKRLATNCEPTFNIEETVSSDVETPYFINTKTSPYALKLFDNYMESNVSNQNLGNAISAAKPYSVPVTQVKKMINESLKSDEKMVFLTFDDGPNVDISPKILDILDQHGVHATFFVVGSRLNNPTNKNILKRAYYSGHAIGNHTISHNLKTLYPSNKINVPCFIEEIKKNNNLLKSILGNQFNSNVVRLPGGYISRQYYNDQNLPELNQAFINNHFISIDWNAETGDATSKNYSPSQLTSNAIGNSKGHNVVVLLMHDVKYSTIESLPEIINYYKNNNYKFKVITN